MAAKKRGTKTAKRAKEQVEARDQDTDNLPVGSPLSAPDAAFQSAWANLPQELQSIIVDIQNNRYGAVGDLLPAITERLSSVRATIIYAMQGAHTASPIAANTPNQPLAAFSQPTKRDMAVGPTSSSRKAAARAARGAELAENNAPGTPPVEPPPITPPAEQEPGESV